MKSIGIPKMAGWGGLITNGAKLTTTIQCSMAMSEGRNCLMTKLEISFHSKLAIDL
jgi:hypothetical protein